MTQPLHPALFRRKLKKSLSVLRQRRRLTAVMVDDRRHREGETQAVRMAKTLGVRYGLGGERGSAVGKAEAPKDPGLEDAAEHERVLSIDITIGGVRFRVVAADTLLQMRHRLPEAAEAGQRGPGGQVRKHHYPGAGAAFSEAEEAAAGGRRFHETTADQLEQPLRPKRRQKFRRLLLLEGAGPGHCGGERLLDFG